MNRNRQRDMQNVRQRDRNRGRKQRQQHVQPEGTWRLHDPRDENLLDPVPLTVLSQANRFVQLIRHNQTNRPK